MNLTFKRDTLSNINNTDLKENMLSFCTDANRIFFDCYKDGQLVRMHMGGEYENVYDSETIYDNYLKQNEVGSTSLTNKRIVNYQYLNTNIGSANLTEFSDGTLTNACNFLEEYTKGELRLIWSNEHPNDSLTDITININQAYQGYVLIFKKAVGTTAQYANDNLKYLPLMMFTLPQSIATTDYVVVSSEQQMNSTQYGDVVHNLARLVTLDVVNKTITIGASRRTGEQFSTVGYPETLIPIEIYGWGL